MRIFAYLFQHKAALLAVVLLLLVQAFCDLSLPNYTSDIVDVGIQQQGIEHAALTDMRGQTYNALLALCAPEDRTVVAESYERTADGVYRLTDAGKADIEKLDAIEALPIAALSYADDDGFSGKDILARILKGKKVSDSQVAALKEQVQEALADTDGSLIRQRAVAYDITEYEALGIDLDTQQMSYLFSKGGQMLLLTLLLAVAAALVSLVASRTAAKIGRSLRERLFSKVMSFSFAEMNRFSSASLITRSTNDIQQIQMVSMFMMRLVLYAPLLGIGGVVMVAYTNVNMTWVIALAVVVISGVMLLMLAATMPKFRMMQALIDRVNLIAREILTGLSVIRAFRRESHEQQRFDAASGDLMKTQLFTNRVMISMSPLLTIGMNGVSVLIVWVAAQQVSLGAMQVGDMIAFITYAMMIIMSFLMLSMVAIMLPRAAVAAGRVEEVLNTEVSVSDPQEPVDLASVEKEAGDAAGTVEFDHVYFRYGNAEQDTLSDISFTAEPGKTTAIIGSTGSGKSTLLNLIPRFFDVTAGSVRIDGVDLRQARQSDIRALIGYVPQKGVLFSGTVEDNLKFAGPQIDDARMQEAARIAQAQDFIQEMVGGYQAPIAQGGANVSGGQKQRLGIARALAADARILLFDDSFSALDYQTDARLRSELASRPQKQTVIIVAQRIATVLHADQIIVLDEGRIVGKGTHGELLKTCSAYREIAQSQLPSSELQGEVR